MTSSYIEDFLEQTNCLPREITRNLMFIKELDEKFLRSQEKLCVLKKAYLSRKNNAKEGAKPLSSSDQELLKQIQQEHETSINLCDNKIETSSECFFVVEYNLKKLNDIIDQFKKNISLATNDCNNSTKNTMPNTLLDEPYVAVSNNSKKKLDNYSEKEYRFLNRKKANASKKKEREEIYHTQYNELDEVDLLSLDKKNDINEKLYCICNKPSYGDMIQCDNNSCAKEWFHFECMNLVTQPKGKWYCSTECLNKAKKKKNKA